MPKRSRSEDLPLGPREEATPRFRWLYDALRQAILNGRLRPGGRLPSTRDLAAQYGVSRGTVIAAFEQLTAEGYLEPRAGAGTFVSPAVASRRERPRTIVRRTVALPSPIATEWHPLPVSPFPSKAPVDLRPFQAHVPALDAFPRRTWARLVGRRLRRSAEMLMDADPRGYQPLRHAVAGYLSATRGVRCSADTVVIVSGVQQALDLVARLIIDHGDPVWLEDPGYPGARYLLEAVGARTVPIPVDQHGLTLPGPSESAPTPKLIVVTPARQSPLGMMMPVARRMELLAYATRVGAWILEDDYDGEYRYASRPLPALQGLTDAECVIYAGTFNKVLFPALRIGYVVVPDPLVDPFIALLSLTSRYRPTLEQAALCDFIEQGHFARHVRRTRELYAARHDALVDATTRELAGLLDVAVAPAGLETIGWLPRKIDDRRAAAAIARANLVVSPLSSWTRRARLPPGLVLGVAAFDERAIRSGVSRLTQALAPLAHEKGRAALGPRR